MKHLVRKLLRNIGYDIIRYGNGAQPESFPRGLTEEEKEMCRSVAEYTMASYERTVCLMNATKYIVEHRIEGDFVECGVWRGGSMMVVARTLMKMGDTSRQLYLYDTFTGMTPPSEKDKRFDGKSADQVYSEAAKTNGKWCFADTEDVRRNLLSTGYPEGNIHLVEGKVEETIPLTLPSRICLLRLDTDWYESTRHELTHLYPNLVRNGVLILDDYGHWQGVQQATDEYFNQFAVKPFLQRVDYAGRIAIKTEGGIQPES
jgi:hypothetical protein